MKPLPHVYTARLTGGAEGYAVVAATGVAELRTAPPADFDGPGDAWSPEQFLMAAVETCLLFTFRAVARASKLEFTSLEVSGEGTVDRKRRSDAFYSNRPTSASDVAARRGSREGVARP